MGWLETWWRQSDHYDQLSSHLRPRGFEVITRCDVAGIALTLALIELATIWSETGAVNHPELACAAVSVAGATAGGLLWALRWPTRRQSKWFAVISSVSIALASLSQHDPTAALMTCTTFATIAGYTALFHTAPLMVFNFVFAAGVGVFAAVRVIAVHGIATAACGFALIMVLNMSVPFGLQATVHLLGADAVRAERDQLTGLLTRRAFHRRAKACLARGAQQRAHVVVTVIDLDRFKQINDNYGHGVGDEALVAVARALRNSNNDTAVIGRAGGEEFVIADIWHPDEVSRRAQQLCEVIAGLPFAVTASVGTAGVEPACRTGSLDDMLVELIVAADAAMYVAKRHGGNQAAQHEWPPLVGTEDDSHHRGGLSA